MNGIFALFWAVMIFGSIAWYAFLVFHIGIKGGREMKEMTQALSKRPENKKPH